MKVFKTLLGYNDLESIEKTLKTFNIRGINIFLDCCDKSESIKETLLNNDNVNSVTIFDEHKGIHLAPLAVYEYIPKDCTHLMHLDDDLLCANNYYKAVLSALKQLNVDIISNDINNSSVMFSYNHFNYMIPQWSNVLLSRNYITEFINSEWYIIYRTKSREEILEFVLKQLDKLKKEETPEWVFKLKQQQFMEQDGFQNLFCLMKGIKFALLLRPRITLQRIKRTHTTTEFVDDNIVKYSELCSTYKDAMEWQYI